MLLETFIAELTPSFNNALARACDASFIHGAGGNEIDASLYPKHVPVVLHIA